MILIPTVLDFIPFGIYLSVLLLGINKNLTTTVVGAFMILILLLIFRIVEKNKNKKRYRKYKKNSFR